MYEKQCSFPASLNHINFYFDLLLKYISAAVVDMYDVLCL